MALTKNEFIAALRDKLSGLADKELDERLDFYAEMIDDRIEDGPAEEQAVMQIGSVDEVVSQILSEIPLSLIAKKKIKSAKRPSTLETVLLAVGSPLWLSLLIAAFSVVFSLYLSVWSVIVSFWAVFASLAACAAAGIVSGAVFVATSTLSSGLFIAAAGLICAGLSIFCFFGCAAATKHTAIATKRIVLGIKKRLIKKEEA